MIRIGDRVLVNDRDTIATVSDFDRKGGIVYAGKYARQSSAVTLVCSSCDAPASRFLAADSRPICDACAGDLDLDPSDLADVRCDPAAIVLCICGESLDDAKSEGIWTLADVACEYRTCNHCHSTRAYAPADHVYGRRVHCYANPETSEISGEWESFLDAIQFAPPSSRAELRRNGVVLAHVYRGIDDVHGWRICKPEKETPCTV